MKDSNNKLTDKYADDVRFMLKIYQHKHNGYFVGYEMTTWDWDPFRRLLIAKLVKQENDNENDVRLTRKGLSLVKSILNLHKETVK